MTNFNQMSTPELVSCLTRSVARESSLRTQGYPTSEQHAISATIRMILAERLGVKV